MFLLMSTDPEEIEEGASGVMEKLAEREKAPHKPQKKKENDKTAGVDPMLAPSGIPKREREGTPAGWTPQYGMRQGFPPQQVGGVLFRTGSHLL